MRPIDAAVVAVMALGVFHGLNPAQGWLFAVFKGRAKKSLWHLAATIVVVSLGHAASLVPVILLSLLVTAYTSLAPLFIGLTLTAFGTYRFLRMPRHRAIRLQVGYRQLWFWGLLAGIAHGSGLTLLPFLTSQTALALGLYHYAAMMSTMFAVALVMTLLLGLSALRKIWVNFDFAWSVILVVIGSAMVLSTFVPLEPPGA